MAGGKEYICVMKLHADASEEQVRQVLAEFTGEIYQKPPLRSSVKRQTRTRYIYYNELLAAEGRVVLTRIGCQSGTYVRKIVHDIGEILGAGAHMAELRRTRAGPFTEDDSLVTLHQLADCMAAYKESGDEGPLRKMILPVERATDLLPRIWVKDSAVDAICHGADLAAPGVCKYTSDFESGELVAIMTLKDELVALGRARLPASQLMDVEKGTVVKTERVIMRAGTYPKLW